MFLWIEALAENSRFRNERNKQNVVYSEYTEYVFLLENLYRVIVFCSPSP